MGNTGLSRIGPGAAQAALKTAKNKASKVSFPPIERPVCAIEHSGLYVGDSSQESVSMANNDCPRRSDPQTRRQLLGAEPSVCLARVKSLPVVSITTQRHI